MSLIEILLGAITALLAVSVGLQWRLIREMCSVEIVQRHKGEWVLVKRVSLHSKQIEKALSTQNWAVRRNGRIEEGEQ